MFEILCIIGFFMVLALCAGAIAIVVWALRISTTTAKQNWRK